MNKISALILVMALIAGCKCNQNKNGSTGDGSDSSYVDISELPDSLKLKAKADSIAATASYVPITPETKDSLLKSATKEVFTFMRNKNYAALDSMIHPEMGVRFSPYASVEPQTDKVFSREEFQKLFTTNKNKKYNWGSYDGSGNPILLTAPEYFKEFVYDKNYITPGKFGINKQIGKGNSINNITSAYKDGDYTESNFSGTKKYGGMDWKSVRLIFQPYNGKYYLIGVVHDGWTI